MIFLERKKVLELSRIMDVEEIIKILFIYYNIID